jgi:hypothetical protein
VRENLGGYLTALALLDPEAGWGRTTSALTDPARPFDQRLSALGAARFLGGVEKALQARWTIGQDEASSVVYGMPREAANVGAVAEVASLDGIAGKLLAHLQRLDRN